MVVLLVVEIVMDKLVNVVDHVVVLVGLFVVDGVDFIAVETNKGYLLFNSTRGKHEILLIKDIVIVIVEK